MKKIVIAILALAIVGGIVGYYMFSEETEKVTQEESVETLKAADFISAYSANQSEYNQKYLDKALTISGEVVNAVTTDNGYNIELKGADDLETVSCLFDKSAFEGRELPKEGETINVKGKCTGYTEEDMMGLKTINMVQCLII